MPGSLNARNPRYLDLIAMPQPWTSRQDYAAMMRRRVSPPANPAVVKLCEAHLQILRLLYGLSKD